MKLIRVLRVVEYVGDEETVNRQIERSIQGTTFIGSRAFGGRITTPHGQGVQITAATIEQMTPEMMVALDDARKKPGGFATPELKFTLPITLAAFMSKETK